MTTEQKILHYSVTKWNQVFMELHNTIKTVSGFVKPIYPEINSLKYLEYFFKEINFDHLEWDSKPSKKEILKYCNAIYYGLDQLFKVDIDQAIFKYQNSISSLSPKQISAAQISLNEILGDLKRQSRNNEPGISFAARYNRLYKEIQERDELLPIDYRIIIFHFNETISNDLVSTFEIIIETLNRISPLLAQNESAASPDDLFHFFDLYFDAHSSLMGFQKNYLYQCGGATENYYTAIRSEQEKVAEVGSKFIKEIRRNVLNFENQDQRKSYLEQVQRKLNVVYDCLELDQKTKVLEALEYHSSFPTIQNLIRDFAITSDIEITGDRSGLTVKVVPPMSFPDLAKRYAEVPVHETISKVWWGQTKDEQGQFKHDPFHSFGNVYAPGYFYNWFNEAEDGKLFDPSINLSKEIDKYAKGFQKGYKEFVEKAANVEQVKELAFGIIQKLISERPQPVSHIKDKKGKKFIQPLRWDDFGERVGRVYCSWRLVIENQSLFEPLFKAAFGQGEVKERKERLKVNQIALIHVYENKAITRDNCKEIALQHGYSSKNSGEGLFQDFTTYSSAANRKGKPVPCTPKKLRNKILLLESVCEHLSNKAVQRAKDEIKILQNIFDSEYQ